MGDQEQPLDSIFHVGLGIELRPHRIERPLGHLATPAHLAHLQFARRHRHLLAGRSGAVVGTERPPDEQHVEAEEAEHRPSAGDEKHHAGHEADGAEEQHQDEKARPAQRAVRSQRGGKQRGLVAMVVGGHGHEYTEEMARKKTIRQALRAAKSRKAAIPKRPAKMAAADAKAAKGALPQWSTAEIEEAFRRFHAAEPAPETELEHEDPFTLLVSVVLSAQATDVGVNKATPALFAVADTPAKMLKLGEAKLRNYIKTIGLYRTKAKNLIALSNKLVEEHGGEVPREREALEALPGVGRKTANVVLNVAFGESTMAVDTHIFRIGNRTGLAPGKTPREVEDGLVKRCPPQLLRDAHHWLILHGRYVCKARLPECWRCVALRFCRYDNKVLAPPPRPKGRE